MALSKPIADPSAAPGANLSGYSLGTTYTIGAGLAGGAQVPTRFTVEVTTYRDKPAAAASALPLARASYDLTGWLAVAGNQAAMTALLGSIESYLLTLPDWQGAAEVS